VSSDLLGHAVLILGSMVMVGSALLVRHERLRTSGRKMAFAWAAIFAILIVAGLWIDRHR
jgi:hypothetical protein